MVTSKWRSVHHAFLVLLVFCAPVAAQTPRPSVDFRASKRTLDQPAEVRLNWSTKNASDVFVSGIGVVDVSGQLRVQIRSTTTYWLLADGPGGQAWRSVTIVLRGTRSEERRG